MATTEEKQAIERAASALKQGEIGEGEFLRQTSEAWRRTAAYLYAHWRRKLPAWVEVDDVLQELVVQVLEHVRAFDASRGCKIGRFVRWSAIHRTQREMNRWRGASLHGNEGSNPGRPEQTFTSAFAPDVDPLALFGVDCAIDEVVEDRRAFRDRLLECRTSAEAVAMQALYHCRGSVPDATAMLFNDLGSRLECGVSTRRGATKLVERVAAELAAEVRAEVERLALVNALPVPAAPFDDDRDSGVQVCAVVEPGDSARAA